MTTYSHVTPLVRGVQLPAGNSAAFQVFASRRTHQLHRMRFQPWQVFEEFFLENLYPIQKRPATGRDQPMAKWPGPGRQSGLMLDRC